MSQWCFCPEIIPQLTPRKQSCQRSLVELGMAYWAAKRASSKLGWRGKSLESLESFGLPDITTPSLPQSGIYSLCGAVLARIDAIGQGSLAKRASLVAVFVNTHWLRCWWGLRVSGPAETKLQAGALRAGFPEGLRTERGRK